MQRHDAARTGISPDPLPMPLQLLWVWHLPERNAMFGTDRRSRLDGAYDGTVVGNTLYVGCEYNDSLVALDTDTGAEKWRFYAEGAVRFSPVIWQGKAYFGADDGRLYCLDAASGKLLWRFDGAPGNRKIINHQRIASNWPVAGGPVLEGGVVCFSCGSWPLEGVSIYGVDAKSGKRLWYHDRWDVISNGYLAIRDGQLALRMAGASLDAKTGLPAPASKKQAAAGMKWTFARELWQQCDQANLPGGVRLPEGWDPYLPIAKAGNVVFGAGHFWRPDRLEAGAGLHWPVAKPPSDNALVGIEEPAAAAKPKVVFAHRFDSRVLDTVCADNKLFVMTQGGEIYCFAGKQAARGAAKADAARHLELVPPRAPWADDQTTAAVRQVLDATGQREGFCFLWGLHGERMMDELLQQSRLQLLALDTDAAKVDTLRRKLDDAGLYRGRLQLYVGDPPGFGLPPYAASLIVSEDLSTSGFNSGKAFFASAFHALRPYGGTLALMLSDSQHQQLARWVAESKPAGGKLKREGKWSLLVREGPLPGAADWTHETCDAANSICAPDKLVRAPLSVLWFGGPAAQPNMTYAAMLPPGLLVCAGRYIMQAPEKLSAIDAYSGRQLWQVALPRVQPNVTRYGKDLPPYVEAAAGELPACEVSRGTGLNAVAAAGGIYVAAGEKCLWIDPASGKTLGAFAMPLSDPQAKKLCWGRLYLAGDLLVATAFDPADIRATFSAWGNNNEKNKDRLPMRWLLAVDRRSGKLVWKQKAVDAFNGRAVAIGNGKVFCLDMLTDLCSEAYAKAGRKTHNGPPAAMALDLRTGRTLWRRPIDVMSTKIAYSVERDMLVLPCRTQMAWRANRWVDLASEAAANPKRRNEGGIMVALAGKDGKELWRASGGAYDEPVVIWHDVILSRHGHPYNLSDGQPAVRRAAVSGEGESWKCPKGGCNFLVAGEHVMTNRTRYYDCQHHSGQAPLLGMRAGCTPSIIPADGVMSLLNYSGGESTDPFRSAVVFVHNPEAVNWMEYAPGPNARRTPDDCKRLNLNLAAPGDHAGPDGSMWFRQGPGKKGQQGNSLALKVAITPESAQAFCVHPARFRHWQEGGLPMVAASGLEGIESLVVSLGEKAGASRRYTVRLHFGEVEDLRPQQRVFDVELQGKPALKGFDIVSAAGGPLRAIAREFRGIAADKAMSVTLKSRTPAKPAVLCGIEIIAE